MIGVAKVIINFDMKVIEALKFNSGLLKNLQTVGIKVDDTQYIALYDDYTRMQSEGGKMSYIVAILAEKYHVCERTVYSLIKKFESDCKSFAADNP